MTCDPNWVSKSATRMTASSLIARSYSNISVGAEKTSTVRHYSSNVTSNSLALASDSENRKDDRKYSIRNDHKEDRLNN